MLKPNIVDIIPNIASAESEQNSEPSLAVDPFDPRQMIAGSFGSGTPYFKTVNSGTTWSHYGNLDTDDKSLAWKQDGSAALTATLLELTPPPNTTAEIRTYSGTTAGSNFGSPIQIFNPSPSHDLDQPWMRTGPSNHVYVTYNDLSASGGKTASVLVSTDGGSHYTSFTLDRVGGSAPSGFAQDAPTVRSAVNGNTVYAIFTRWNTVVENDSDGARLGSQVVIVRSDDGGADLFTAFGPGDGVQVATTISAFPPDTPSPTTPQTPLTLGQERIGGDAAIAVDPNNAMHVVVAYGNAPGPNHSGELQLVVTESTNGGMTWTQKFATPAVAGGVKSALPALSILQNGTIALYQLRSGDQPALAAPPDDEQRLRQHPHRHDAGHRKQRHSPQPRRSVYRRLLRYDQRREYFLRCFQRFERRQRHRCPILHRQLSAQLHRHARDGEFSSN